MRIWILCEHERCANWVLSQLAARPSSADDISLIHPADLGESGDDDPHLILYPAPELLERDLALVERLRSSTAATIAVVSDAQSKTSVLNAIRRGADDFLSLGPEFNAEYSALCCRWSSKQSRAAEGRLIAVAPCHATNDAALLAVNLAAVAARNGSSILVDFQMRSGDAALMLKLVPRHTVLDLVQGREDIDSAMFEQALISHESGIKLLAGPEPYSDLRQIETSLCEQIVHFARQCSDSAIVITEDDQHPEQIATLTAADVVLITVRPDLVSIYRAKRQLEFLARRGISSEAVRIVAMGTGYPGELSTKDMMKILGISQLDCVPDDPYATIVSLNLGHPLVLESPKSKASKAISSLADNLLGVSTQTKRGSTKVSLPLKAASVLAINVANALR